MNSNQKMKVIVVEPNKPPRLKEIDPGLDSLQKEVGGYIETVYPFTDPVVIVCDEEGKLKGSPPNRALRDKNGQVYDFLCGTFLVAGVGDDDICSIPQDLVSKYMKHFRRPEHILNLNGRLFAFRTKK